MTTINPALRAATVAQLSERHERWGDNCPATDIDALLVEYDRAEARAIVEYKFWANTRHIDFTTPSMRAVAALATDAGRPFFAVRYCPDRWLFRVHAGNEVAREYLPAPRTMTELEWVSLQYEVRGRTLPEHLRGTLKNDDSDEDEEEVREAA